VEDNRCSSRIETIETRILCARVENILFPVIKWTFHWRFSGFFSGAAGVILSRKYSEMKLANLAAAGEALKEIGV